MKAFGSLKFLLKRISLLLAGGALSVLGSYLFSLGFSMQNSASAELCFGSGITLALIGLFGISGSINLKKWSNKK